MTIAAFRHNNPFDVSLPIAGYSGPGTVAGIQGQSGYGSFPDMSTGYGAGVQRLNSYISGQSSHGPKSTINELNTVYATDPNWAKGVAKFSGIGSDEKLDLNDPAQMSKLQYGVLAQEIGPANAAQVIQNYAGAAPPAPQPQAGENTPGPERAAPVNSPSPPSAPLNISPTNAIPQQPAPIMPQAPQQAGPDSGSAPPQFAQIPQMQAPPIFYAPRRPVNLTSLKAAFSAPVFPKT